MTESEPTYQELEAQYERLEPWIAFMIKHEGSEIGDYYRFLDEGWGVATSAQEYGHAKQMLDMLEEMIDNAKLQAQPGGWVHEMIEMNQFDHESYMKQFKDEHRPDIKSPKQELEELLNGNHSHSETTI